MRVCVIVATFGDQSWQAMGDAAMERSMLRHVRPQVTFLRWHSQTLAGSRNTAAFQTNADWLCFQDADDQLAPGYFDAMELAMLDQSIGNADPLRVLYVPAVQYVWADHVDPPVDLHAEQLDENGEQRPLIEINFAVIGTLISRSLFLEVGGFDPRLPIYEDWELWLRCERAGARFVDVPEAVYEAQMGRPGARNRGSGLAQNWYGFIRREEEQVRAGLQEPRPLPSLPGA